ncbi:uncharacterized protein LOC122507370 isoform X1 [Leptopilina heterotoma]|uniref:uncharacterized protein LOC122507370 isoform X1 n=1 Tax=Leptopilina heterotoma TaxID=63436 RepID=UPI001CA9104B|nr:uncharacterized protein LOC122507370 isoform X1 [Leptopilina heterotoma]XP_043475968.1 uncharacterized protein LOC122507370 isoform X1 [Leptopilina heterotoma]XP_043475969.1 uncharacterized protein LOC122507370 isoform X1 [Leptopilina heterotoma]XP_043475970.1 uncharacterized protein LOC122507370 isoform X1 [Leptopilina heterotoma]
MALFVSSTQTPQKVKNGSLSTTICAKCICCPYGYHIDLDFVRYCEAVAAGCRSRSGVDRREKKERRRQCQSMEFLLGLVSSVSPKPIGNSTELSNTSYTADEPSSSKPNVVKDANTNYISELDLSDVVDDFEAALLRSSESYKNETENKNALLFRSESPVDLKVARSEITSREEFDGLGNMKSNLSTGKLQNIREQMAESLKRMKELEVRVKAIPILQVQLFVLAEEKRKLLEELKDYNDSKTKNNANKIHRLRSHSLSENQSCKNQIDASVRLKRDIGISCTVMTRDVGVSHQQVQTKDAGMLISLPVTPQKKLTNSKTRIECIMPVTTKRNFTLSKSTQSELTLESIESMLNQNSLNEETALTKVKSFQDCGINTEVQQIEPTSIPSDNVSGEEFKSKIKTKADMVNKETMTSLTTENIGILDDNHVGAKKHVISLNSLNDTKSIIKLRGKENLKNKHVQTMHVLCSNVSVTAKPVTFDTGTDAMNRSTPKSVAVGPDLTTSNSISLNSMNSQNTPFKYDGTQLKRVASKYVSVNPADLIKSASKNTDTLDLKPRTRDFGTSPVRKKFTDMSVGESLKFNENISHATNYCDNCKNISKQFKNQTKHNIQNNISKETATPTFHRNILEVSENNSHLKKQDNRDQYESVGRLELDKFIDTNEENTYFKAANDLNVNAEFKEENYPNRAAYQFQTIKPRKKLTPAKEIISAIKIMNDNFEKLSNRNMSSQIKSAFNLVQQEWFKISSTENANPRDVKDYLDLFQEYPASLLIHIVNVTDCSGNTAMHYAVSFGNFDVASALLDSQVCDLNKPNTAGYTAVMLAALADVRNFMHTSVAERIFQNSNVNIQSKMDGQTALMLAVSHGRLDMTKLLLDAGADMNIQDEDGSTALMCAAEHGHMAIVRLLLNQTNCDSSILDLDGSSALKIALEAGHHDIGVLLYAHEHVNKGTNPYFVVKRSRKNSKSSVGSCASASVNLG